MKKEQLRTLNSIKDAPKLSLCEKLLSLPEQAEYGLSIEIESTKTTKKVCMFGIGESSIAGDVIVSYSDDYSTVPIVNISSNIVPRWVDSNTDVIIVSYSGDNSVINAIYDEVKKRKSIIYCIVNKGILKRKCEENGDKLFLIPEGLTSRSSVGFELGVLASLIEKMGVCNSATCLRSVIPTIKEYRDSIFTDTRIYDLKYKLHDNTIAVYGSPDFQASFKRWKMSLNDDIGTPSFCGELPEFNHNEIVGWANHNQDDSDLKIVMLRGKYKNDVVTKITDKTVEVLEENGRHVIDIIIPGDNPIEKNMRAILLADYLSQLMKLEGKNPMSWRGSV